jgi:hypothetical protein
MSKKLFLILFVSTLVIAGCEAKQATTEAEQGVYGFPFNTAKIEYTLTGSAEGTRTLYIKGDKIANQVNVSEKSGEKEIKRNIKTLELGSEYITINLDDKTAVKTANYAYNELKKLPADARQSQLIKLATGNAYPGATMPVKEGQKNIAGQTCDLYKMSTFGTVCLWNGLPINSEIKIESEKVESVSTATKIELNVDIPDNVFQIPTDVKVQEPATQQQS